MKKIPTSILIISWYLILGSALSLYAVRSFIFNSKIQQNLSQSSSLPTNMQVSLTLIICIINLLCGIAMLNKINWARFLYIISAITSLTITIFYASTKVLMIPSVVILSIVITFLLLPKANKYFNNEI